MPWRCLFGVAGFCQSFHQRFSLAYLFPGSAEVILLWGAKIRFVPNLITFLGLQFDCGGLNVEKS